MDIKHVKGPLLMIAKNFQKCIDGSKTHTRRIEKLSKINDKPDDWQYDGLSTDGVSHIFIKKYLFAQSDFMKIKPRHAVGDILYLPEKYKIHVNIPYASYIKNFTVIFADLSRHIFLMEDLPEVTQNKIRASLKGKWHTSRFMFKFMAQQFVEIIGVKCERLRPISARDCIAEGIKQLVPMSQNNTESLVEEDRIISEFRKLWDSINSKTYPWASNPWVIAYTFKAVT